MDSLCAVKKIKNKKFLTLPAAVDVQPCVEKGRCNVLEFTVALRPHAETVRTIRDQDRSFSGSKIQSSSSVQRSSCGIYSIECLPLPSFGRNRSQDFMGEVMHTVKGTVLTEGTAGMVESACAAVQRFTPKCSEKNCRSVTILFVCFSLVVLSSALAGQNS